VKVVLIYATGWVGMVALAILNAAMCEKVYGPLIRELSAHQLSTFILLILFGVYVWLLTGICRIGSSRQAFVIGAMWLIMTMVFEFIFGHYLMDHSWERLFHDYNLLEGKVWSLILIWITIAPYVFYRLRS